jgi:hypothetical protein
MFFSCIHLSINDCRNSLLSLVENKDNINATNVARILAMMARTHVVLSDQQQQQNQDSNENKENYSNNAITSWNVDVYVQAVQELV